MISFLFDLASKEESKEIINKRQRFKSNENYGQVSFRHAAEGSVGEGSEKL